MRRRANLVIAIVVVLMIAAIAARMFVRGPWQGERAAYRAFTADIMHAPISVSLPERAGEDAAAVVFDVFRDVEREMNEWRPGSPLAAINEAAGREPVVVPEELFALIERGIEIGEMTGGAFDITWAALWGVWDFKADEPRVPADQELEARLDLIDFHRVRIDEAAGTVYLPEPGMKIGLGGIAKGYALDRAAEALRGAGVTSFLISAGGQVLVRGMRGDRPWRVGIRDPRSTMKDYFAFLEVTDTSVSTSGDYERFFILDGVRYHHILDPRTGRPARGLLSATVICADATLADALSTAMMVMGRDRALALAESRDDVEAVLIDDAFQVHVTSGLEDRLTIRYQPIP
jgi:thiamine biosynthesis lipoprotein